MIQLPEKDRELILNWNKQITSLGDGFKVTLFIDAYSALSIISRYQKALDLALYYVEGDATHEALCEKVNKILNGGEG